jgi:hypothetical protein
MLSRALRAEKEAEALRFAAAVDERARIRKSRYRRSFILSETGFAWLRLVLFATSEQL